MLRRQLKLNFCLQRISSSAAKCFATENGSIISNLNFTDQLCQQRRSGQLGGQKCADFIIQDAFSGSQFLSQRFSTSTKSQGFVDKFDEEFGEKNDDDLHFEKTETPSEENMQDQNRLMKQIQQCRSLESIYQILSENSNQIDQNLLSQASLQTTKIYTQSVKLEKLLQQQFVKLFNQNEFSDGQYLFDFIKGCDIFEGDLEQDFFYAIRDAVHQNASKFSCRESATILSSFQRKTISPKSTLKILVENIISDIGDLKSAELALVIRNCGSLGVWFQQREYEIFESAVLSLVDKLTLLDIVRIFQGMGDLRWRRSLRFLEPLNDKIRQQMQVTQKFNPRYAIIFLNAYSQMLLNDRENDLVQDLSDKVLQNFESLNAIQQITMLSALNIFKSRLPDYLFSENQQSLLTKCEDALLDELPKLPFKLHLRIIAAYADKCLILNTGRNNINMELLHKSLQTSQENVSQLRAGLTIQYLAMLSKLVSRNVIGQQEYDEFVQQLVQILQNSQPPVLFGEGGQYILRVLNVPEEVVESMSKSPSSTSPPVRRQQQDTEYDDYVVQL